MKFISLYKEDSHDCFVGMFSTVNKAKEYVVEHFPLYDFEDFFYRVYTIDKGDAGEDNLYRKERFY